MHFFNGNEWILSRISLKFVPKVRINNIPSLVQIMAWRRPGDKPLSEPMMVSLLTHICVTRPQWVKYSGLPIYRGLCSPINSRKTPIASLLWRAMGAFRETIVWFKFYHRILGTVCGTVLCGIAMYREFIVLIIYQLSFSAVYLVNFNTANNKLWFSGIILGMLLNQLRRKQNWSSFFWYFQMHFLAKMFLFCFKFYLHFFPMGRLTNDQDWFR